VLKGLTLEEEIARNPSVGLSFTKHIFLNFLIGSIITSFIRFLIPHWYQISLAYPFS